MKNAIQLSMYLLFGILFTACSSYQATEESEAYVESVSYESRSEATADVDKIVETERKVIYNADMRIKVEEVETQTETVIAKAKEQGGYMVSSDIDYVNVRVPAEKLNSFLDEIATMGEVESRNVYSRDITEAYADLGIRLENAEKTRRRYLELLDKAENVSDILEIERELERLNTDIERMKGLLNSYDKQVQYSSVSINFFTKAKPGPLGYIFVGLYKGVKFLFVRN